MTIEEFENTASELVRMAIVSKEIGRAELIDVTKACPAWAAEIKAGFEPSGMDVKVLFTCDLSNDYVVCEVTNAIGWSYNREVDFSPEDGQAIAKLVHPENSNAYSETY